MSASGPVPEAMVKMWGKSPQRSAAMYCGYGTRACKTKYTDRWGLPVRCQGVGCVDKWQIQKQKPAYGSTFALIETSLSFFNAWGSLSVVRRGSRGFFVSGIFRVGKKHDNWQRLQLSVDANRNLNRMLTENWTAFNAVNIEKNQRLRLKKSLQACRFLKNSLFGRYFCASCYKHTGDNNYL